VIHTDATDSGPEEAPPHPHFPLQAHFPLLTPPAISSHSAHTKNCHVLQRSESYWSKGEDINRTLGIKGEVIVPSLSSTVGHFSAAKI
jgi:hypothetical protein